jgi:ABC-type polysaccharide/polyol phosphate export permease
MDTCTLNEVETNHFNLDDKESKHFDQELDQGKDQRSVIALFPKQIQDLWRYRELAIELFWTYLKLRYVGSFLGFLWTMLNPLIFILTYWIVFSQIIRMGISDYPLFLIPGFLAWNFTFNSIVSSSESILDSQYLITKIAFPIEILTFAGIAVTLFDFLVTITLYLVVVVILSPSLPITTIALPLIIIFQALFTTGIALLVACGSVFFRDIPKLIPLLGTIFFFLTPIFYPLTFVPESFQFIIKLNPMTRFITLYHNLLYDKTWPDLWTFWTTCILAIACFIFGYWIFNRKRYVLAELS